MAKIKQENGIENDRATHLDQIVSEETFEVGIQWQKKSYPCGKHFSIKEQQYKGPKLLRDQHIPGPRRWPYTIGTQ